MQHRVDGAGYARMLGGGVVARALDLFDHKPSAVQVDDGDFVIV